MRKYFSLILLATYVLTSCSSDYKSEKEEVKDPINPPEWLLGTWESEEEDVEVETWWFINNDITMIKEGRHISQLAQIDGFRNAGYPVLVEEEIEEEYYSIKIDYPVGEVIYSFEKAPDNRILWIEKSSFYHL